LLDRQGNLGQTSRDSQTRGPFAILHDQQEHRVRAERPGAGGGAMIYVMERMENGLFCILCDCVPVLWFEESDYWDALAALQELNADVVVEAV